MNLERTSYLFFQGSFEASQLQAAAGVRTVLASSLKEKFSLGVLSKLQSPFWTRCPDPATILSELGEHSMVQVMSESLAREVMSWGCRDEMCHPWRYAIHMKKATSSLSCPSSVDCAWKKERTSKASGCAMRVWLEKHEPGTWFRWHFPRMILVQQSGLDYHNQAHLRAENLWICTMI